MTTTILKSTTAAQPAGGANAPTGKAGAADGVAALFAEMLAQNSSLVQRGKNAGAGAIVTDASPNAPTDAASLKLSALKKLTGTADTTNPDGAAKSTNIPALPPALAALLAKTKSNSAKTGTDIPSTGIADKAGKSDTQNETAQVSTNEQTKAKTKPDTKVTADTQPALATLAISGATAPVSAPTKIADAAVNAVQGKTGTAQNTGASNTNQGQAVNSTAANGLAATTTTTEKFAANDPTAHAPAANGAVAKSSDANSTTSQADAQLASKVDNKPGQTSPAQQTANAADANDSKKAIADTLAKLSVGANDGEAGKAAAQTLARHAPDAQATKAQATPVQFDAASAKLASAGGGTSQNANGQNANGQNTNGQHTNNQAGNHTPSASADASAKPAQIQSVAHTQTQAQAQPSAPAHITAQATPVDTSLAAANAATNAGAVSANNASTIPATLQVTPQTAANAQTQVQPNLAALAVNIATQSNAGTKHFDIRLDPAELGRVDVRLSVDDAGKAQAHLAVDKPQTLAMLQRDSSQLERALRDAGLQLANGSLNFSLKGQDRQDQQANQFSRRGGRNLSVSAIASSDAPTVNPISSSLSAASARLDIRV